MSEKVLVVGSPSTFRQEVAQAIGVQPDAVGWVPNVSAAEKVVAESGQSGGVVVLSPRVDEPEALVLAQRVGRTAPATALVLVRDRELNGTLPEAMRAGIRDVVDLSRGDEELREALERAIVWSSSLVRGSEAAAAEGLRGTVASVFSSKGGTGKTFFASNLAVAIAQVAGRETSVVDLDVELGDVFAYYAADPKRSFEDLMALGRNASQEEVRAVGVPLEDMLWGYGATSDPARQTPSSTSITSGIEALRTAFAFTVIDATAEYSDAMLSALEASDLIFLMTTLDVVAVRHLAKALETLTAIGVPRERLRVVLNRADSDVDLQPREIERVLRVQVDAMIPSSRLVPRSLNRSRPVVLAEPRSNVAAALRGVAEHVVRFSGIPAEPEPDESRRRPGRLRRR